MTLYYSNSRKNPSKWIKYNTAKSSGAQNPIKAAASIMQNPLQPFTGVLKREKNENQDVDISTVTALPMSPVNEDALMPVKRRHVLIMNKLDKIENLLILIVIILTIIMFKNFK